MHYHRFRLQVHSAADASANVDIADTANVDIADAGIADTANDANKESETQAAGGRLRHEQ